MEFTHFLTSAYSLPKNDKKSAASFWQFSVEYRLHTHTTKRKAAP